MTMPIIAGAAWRWGFWFRVLGYGFIVRRGQKMFSERNGYTLAWSVFGFVIVPLHPTSWLAERPRPRLKRGASV